MKYSNQSNIKGLVISIIALLFFFVSYHYAVKILTEVNYIYTYFLKSTGSVKQWLYNGISISINIFKEICY